MVPEAARELVALEIEKHIFNRSFDKVAKEVATNVKTTEAARIGASEATPVSAQIQTLEQIVLGEPPVTNNNWKMEEATEQQNPGDSGKQKPPEIEYDCRLPRAQDQNPVYQSQGCRQHLSVLFKGVIDIVYLASC